MAHQDVEEMRQAVFLHPDSLCSSPLSSLYPRSVCVFLLFLCPCPSCSYIDHIRYQGVYGVTGESAEKEKKNNNERTVRDRRVSETSSGEREGVRKRGIRAATERQGLPDKDGEGERRRKKRDERRQIK